MELLFSAFELGRLGRGAVKEVGWGPALRGTRRWGGGAVHLSQSPFL